MEVSIEYNSKSYTLQDLQEASNNMYIKKVKDGWAVHSHTLKTWPIVFKQKYQAKQYLKSLTHNKKLKRGYAF